MPKVPQKADEYARNDFIAEINAQRARKGLDTFELFGRAIGVSGKTAWNYFEKPDNIRLKDLRSMVKTIKPNPEVMLQVLGYSGKEIKAMAKIIVSR